MFRSFVSASFVVFFFVSTVATDAATIIHAGRLIDGRSDEPREKVRLPEGLLSPRQKLILGLLYERDMEVAEIAAHLGIDPQTVRSTHHKAMLKLIEHFADGDTAREMK